MSSIHSADCGRTPWKAAFAATLQRHEDDAIVARGAAAVGEALDRLREDPFVQAMLEEASHTGNDAAVEIIRAGRLPLGKGDSALLDRAWSLSDVEDRHQRWIVQQWKVVRDCAAEWKRKNSFASLEALMPLLSNWAEANLTPEAVSRLHELNWHDHTTALRAVHLIWLGCLLHRSSVPQASYLPLLFKLVDVHSAVLAADDFHMSGTNHGFDQAYGLYFLTCAFPISDEQQERRELAQSRLRFEMGYAFGQDGVHIENSPSYHVTMMMRLLKAERLLEAYERVAMRSMGQVIEKAITFLAHAIRPDGTLPLLGDSDATPLQLELDRLKSFSTYPNLLYVQTLGRDGEPPETLNAIFPQSGYAFLRDRWPTPTDRTGLHLSLKCGFLSRFHRHDDDNTILLFARGEDWLVGSGIYKYHEQDEIRKYLRSPQASNSLAVDDLVPIRDPKHTRSGITMVAGSSNPVVYAETNMYPGFSYARRLEFERAQSRINLRDVMQPEMEADHRFALRFHVPIDKHVEVVAQDRVRVVSPRSGQSLTISVASRQPLALEIISGRVSPPLGWTSPGVGSLTPATCIQFKLETSNRVELSTSLQFE